MFRDKAGNQLFRKVVVKVLFPVENGKPIFSPKVLNSKAGPRQGFGPEGVADVLDRIADQLDTLYPWWEFKPMELKPEGRTARFVFNFAGYRDVPQPEKVPEPGVERRTATLSAAEDIVEKVKQQGFSVPLDFENPTESTGLELETAEPTKMATVGESVSPSQVEESKS